MRKLIDYNNKNKFLDYDVSSSRIFKFKKDLPTNYNNSCLTFNKYGYLKPNRHSNYINKKVLISTDSYCFYYPCETNRRPIITYIG